MIGPYRIAGYAIVSADGMIADASGTMPETIRNDADQRFLQAELDRAAAVVHGRHSDEGGTRAARRKRLIVTRRVATTAPDRANRNALMWNPGGTQIEEALASLGVVTGTVAIIGGTDVFGLFLPFYDAFHLTRAARATIPDGRPLFPMAEPPEEVLVRYGLTPSPRRDIDAVAGITLTNWERTSSR
jgi:dihydrofolate reductase